MCKKIIFIIVTVVILSVRLDFMNCQLINTFSNNQNNQNNRIVDVNRRLNYAKNEINLNKINLNKLNGFRDERGWYDTAKNIVVSPVGQMAVHFAKEMISRSTGNSQVLSLNLSNLLILILLKALIFAAGLIGTGNWTYFNGRDGRIENEEDAFLRNEEIPLIIGFLAAEGSEQYDCLYRAACKAPKIANNYITAAKALINGAEMINTDIPYSGYYLQRVRRTEKAILEGMDNAPCDSIYHCQM